MGPSAASVSDGVRIAGMLAANSISLTNGNARNAAYDLVLLAHVLSALVGFGAVLVAGGFALALARSGPERESVRRYYRSGVNWAGRVLFLVPVLGFVLMAMSHGEWSLSDGWITIGLLLWAAAALVAELVLWPTERGLQVAVGEQKSVAEVRARCHLMAALSVGFLVVLLVATVVMVGKP